MRINTNVQALNAYRQLSVSQGNVSKNIEKLSSGLRINRAGDDAAGLAISEKMRSQIRGLKMAERNSMDAVSLIQTAEGALQEVHNSLQRMRELSIQAANGTMAEEDRGAIQSEIDQLTFDIDRIAKTTQFNANPLLRGSLMAKPVITTNVADIKYAGSGTWQGTLVTEPTDKASVDFNLAAMADIADANTITINGKVYEFDNDNTITTSNIKVTMGVGGTAVVDTLNNLKAAIIANDDTFDSISSSVTGTILTLKTAKSMSPLEAQKFKVSKDATIGATSGFLKTGIVPATAAIEFTSSNTALYPKSIYLNFEEVPKNGDKMIIDGTTISFSNSSTAYASGTNSATIDITDKSVYDILHEVDQLLTTAQNAGKANAVTTHRANGNSLIMTTDKTEDGLGNGLEIQFIDNDFETYAGRDLQVNMQIGANDSENMKLSIGVVDSSFLGLARKADHKEIIKTAGVDAEAGISVMSEEDAQNAISQFDNAIRMVSESRSRLGAYQNRLEHTISNIGTTHENLTAAESRIRDADMAMEMSEFTKNNIINQAATAMLAQANQLPQGILQLLK